MHRGFSVQRHMVVEGQPCTQRDGAKNEHNQNFWRPAAASSSCSPSKSGAGGATKQPPSSGSWPSPKPGKPPPSCNQPSKPPRSPGGQPSSAAQPARLLQPRSSLKSCPPSIPADTPPPPAASPPDNAREKLGRKNNYIIYIMKFFRV